MEGLLLPKNKHIADIKAFLKILAVPNKADIRKLEYMLGSPTFSRYSSS